MALPPQNQKTTETTTSLQDEVPPELRGLTDPEYKKFIGFDPGSPGGDFTAEMLRTREGEVVVIKTGRAMGKSESTAQNVFRKGHSVGKSTDLSAKGILSAFRQTGKTPMFLRGLLKDKPMPLDSRVIAAANDAVAGKGRTVAKSVSVVPLDVNRRPEDSKLAAALDYAVDELGRPAKPVIQSPVKVPTPSAWRRIPCSSSSPDGTTPQQTPKPCTTSS